MPSGLLVAKTLVLPAKKVIQTYISTIFYSQKCSYMTRWRITAAATGIKLTWAIQPKHRRRRYNVTITGRMLQAMLGILVTTRLTSN